MESANPKARLKRCRVLTGLLAISTVAISSLVWPLARPCEAQLQLPPKVKNGLTLDPAQEIAKQLSGQPTIKIKHDGRNFYGTPLAHDGKNVALLRWDGRVTKLPATTKTQVEVIDRNFLPYTHEELEERLQKEFGSRYKVSSTEHYVVVHPQGKSAIWAEPFEKLHMSFRHWFIDHGLEPKEPQFPLIAVILRSRRDFDRFMKNDIKIANRAILGFYNHKSNRMVMFDPSAKVRVDDQTWLYRDPTIVHEATHQSAFNTNVQNRFSPPPLWMAEGLAMLFETPGYNRSRTFKKPKHRVNRARLAALKKLGRPSVVSTQMTNLIGNDRLFETNPQKFYALAWGMTWYLAEERTDQFIRYLKADIKRKPYAQHGPAAKIKMFSKFFGNDTEQLKQNLVDFYGKHW